MNVCGMIIFLLLFSTNLLSSECTQQAEQFNNNIRDGKSTPLSNSCIKKAQHNFSLRKISRGPASIKSLHKNTVNMYADSNYVVVQKNRKKQIYAGANTGFYQISSVSLNSSQSFFAVLNTRESGAPVIEFFTTRYAGNVSPIYKVDEPQLLGATLLSFSKENENELLVYNSLQATFYSIRLDIQSGKIKSNTITKNISLLKIRPFYRSREKRITNLQSFVKIDCHYTLQT